MLFAWKSGLQKVVKCPSSPNLTAPVWQRDNEMIGQQVSLCSACRGVDWREFVEIPVDPGFSTGRDSLKGPVIGRLIGRVEASHEELRASQCRVCQIISIIRCSGYEQLEKEEDSFDCELEVAPLDSRVHVSPPSKSEAQIAVLGIGTWQCSGDMRFGYSPFENNFLALLGPDQEVGPHRTPTTIQSFGWMRDAITECYENHSDCCRSTSTSPIAGLRVIDCFAGSSSMSVIHAPDCCQYVALSYVWGSNPSEHQDVPTVIKDAMEVTRMLHLKFLWVDKYCIPQDNQEKHNLINAMDQIYSQAYVTIVAAAGHGAEDGLAGVSNFPRRSQVEVKAGDCTLLEVPLGLSTTHESVWATRGWTYQEGYLSLRRLLFTDVGVVYHCRERRVEESIQELVPKGSKVSMQHSLILSSDYKKMLFNDGSRTLESLVEHYTLRQLSYDEDSLNAFKGILNHCARLRDKDGTDSVWGLPVKQERPILEWYHEKPAIRRRNFPSWSWVGWAGGIKFNNMDCVTREVYTNPMFEPVSFEIPPKSSDIQQDHLENASSSWPVEQQKRLTVRGPIIPLRLLTEERLVELLGPIWCSNERSNDFSEEVGLRRYCMFELFPDIFAVVRAQLDSPADVGDSEFGLIMTHNAERDENKAGMFNVNNIIILTRVDDQFERSGYIDMTGGGSCEIYYIDHQRLFTDTKSNRLPWYNSDLERPWLDEVMRATFYLE